MRALAAGCLAGAAAVAAAGCGGGNGSAARSSERGRAVFDRSCAACHTLSGDERGASGGDLAVARMSVADIASFARVMPVKPPLSAAETTAVAEYVHAVAARRRRAG